MIVPPTPSPALDYKDAAIIKLAGIELFVPLLAIRQTRVIIPALGRLLTALDRIREDATALTEDDIDMLMKVIHAALTRAYPNLTLDSLLDQKISLYEMTQAIPVIAQQTGLFKPATPASGDAPATVPDAEAA